MSVKILTINITLHFFHIKSMFSIIFWVEGDLMMSNWEKCFSESCERQSVLGEKKKWFEYAIEMSTNGWILVERTMIIRMVRMRMVTFRFYTILKILIRDRIQNIVPRGWTSGHSAIERTMRWMQYVYWCNEELVWIVQKRPKFICS